MVTMAGHLHGGAKNEAHRIFRQVLDSDRVLERRQGTVGLRSWWLATSTAVLQTRLFAYFVKIWTLTVCMTAGRALWDAMVIVLAIFTAALQFWLIAFLVKRPSGPVFGVELFMVRGRALKPCVPATRARYYRV